MDEVSTGFSVMDRFIAYKGGYKYQLKAPYAVRIPLCPAAPIQTPYICLDMVGELLVKEGYAWDGPSGPTLDTLNFMRGSLVHDALYQLMRERCLDHLVHRVTADRVLRDMCLADGMWRLRAWWVYLGVRWFADFAADPAVKHPLTYAPKGITPLAGAVEPAQ
jgi:hypothetical protein